MRREIIFPETLIASGIALSRGSDSPNKRHIIQMRVNSSFRISKNSAEILLNLQIYIYIY